MSGLNDRFPITVVQDELFVEIRQQEDSDVGSYDEVTVQGRVALAKLISDLATALSRIKED